MVSKTAKYAANLWETLKDLGDLFTCGGALIFYLWVLFLISVISGFYRGNVLTLVGLAAAIIFIVLHIFVYEEVFGPKVRLFFFKLWPLNRGKPNIRTLWSHRERFRKGWLNEYYFSDFPRGELLYYIFMLGVVPLIFSSAITTRTCFVGRAQYAVVGTQVAPLDRWFVMSQPFAPVTWIKSDQLTWVSTLKATTKDNVPIAVEVQSKLLLPADKETILKYAAGPEAVKMELDDRLEAAFKKVVEERSIETLNGGPMLTYLIYLESKNVLRGLPLAWNGEFSITASKVIRQ